MELPIELVLLIHEYDRPMTRPDWKSLHIFPYTHFINDLLNASINKSYQLQFQIEGNVFRKLLMHIYSNLNLN